MWYELEILGYGYLNGNYEIQYNRKLEIVTHSHVRRYTLLYVLLVKDDFVNNNAFVPRRDSNNLVYET